MKTIKIKSGMFAHLNDGTVGIFVCQSEDSVYLVCPGYSISYNSNFIVVEHRGQNDFIKCIFSPKVPMSYDDMIYENDICPEKSEIIYKQNRFKKENLAIGMYVKIRYLSYDNEDCITKTEICLVSRNPDDTINFIGRNNVFEGHLFNDDLICNRKYSTKENIRVVAVYDVHLGELTFDESNLNLIWKEGE